MTEMTFTKKPAIANRLRIRCALEAPDLKSILNVKKHRQYKHNHPSLAASTGQDDQREPLISNYCLVNSLHLIIMKMKFKSDVVMCYQKNVTACLICYAN